MPDQVSREQVIRRNARNERKRKARQQAGTIIIGTLIACRKCTAEFPKRHKRQFYCDDCKEIEPNTGRRVGEPWTCANCPAAIIIRHPRMIYCDRCQELRRRNLLAVYKTASNARNRKRRASDPQFAISRDMSSGIRKSLVDGKGGRSWENLVGYTIVDLMGHLERQFRRGMTWENRHRWHIDHIIPLSKLEFSTPDDPQFKLAWALTNLRPLWKRENLLKSGNRTLLL